MLEIRDVYRRLGGQPVLSGVSLTLAQGEIVCLLGPSGSGKTTLLRAIAGLEQVDSGDILLDDQSLLDVPVHERGFGLMFQDFALFPHLDVARNIAFGLKMGGQSRSAQVRRVRDVLELVNLPGFEARPVAQLSGGERQRVALARSLAPNPRLLMLDEPLGSLDAALREALVVELRAIIKALGLTALYVTHDQREAFAIADRMAILNAGRIEQIDTPERLYQRPMHAFVARFLGLPNIIPVLAREGDQVRTPLGAFSAAEGESLLLHPDGITIDAEGDLEVTVREVVFQGDVYRLRVVHPSGTALTFKHPSSASFIPQPDQTLAVSIRPSAVIPLRDAAHA